MTAPTPTPTPTPTSTLTPTSTPTSTPIPTSISTPIPTSIYTKACVPDNAVNGRTAVLGVIGDPVAHSFSPQIHRYFAMLYGINGVYVPFHVTGDHLKTALEGAKALGLRGLNVTIPHKRAVMPYLDEIDAMAARIGSVNTLAFTEAGLIGYNTDYIGITHTLTGRGLSFEHRPVTVFGAGGSAYAACMAAAEGGASHINIINRTPRHGAVLAAHVKKHYTVTVRSYDLDDYPSAGTDAIVIQTTTMGFGSLTGHSPVAGIDRAKAFFDGIALAFDIIYTPWETLFLRQAAEAGVQTVNGFPMLVSQAAASFVRWCTECDVATDREVTYEALSAPSHTDALARLFKERHDERHDERRDERSDERNDDRNDKRHHVD